MTETLEENEILCKREQELDGCIVDTQTIARAEKLLEYFQNLNIEVFYIGILNNILQI